MWNAAAFNINQLNRAMSAKSPPQSDGQEELMVLGIKLQDPVIDVTL